MPKIKNYVLPPALVDELVEAAREFETDLVIEWGRAALPGGFTKPDIIRERMIARFRSDGALDALSSDMLRFELPYRETIAALSLPTLQELLTSFCVVAGTNAFLLSLLVDPREEVHRWAVEVASKPPPFPEPSPARVEEAEDRILSFVEERFLWEFGLDLKDAVPAPLPSPAAMETLTSKALEESSRKLREQQQRLDHLNSELQNQKQRYLAKLKEQTEAAEREKRALNDQVRTAQEQAGKAAREKHALESRLAEAAKERDAQIARGVREQTSALVRKWLEPAQQVEAALAPAGAAVDDLVTRAARVLDAQTRQDRHSGNRRELQSRIETLAKTREQLLAALQNALVPVAELKPLLTEVEAELEKLYTILAAKRSRSELGSRLLGSINMAGTWDEVRQLSRLVDQFSDHDLLPPGEIRDLLAAVHRKFSLLTETDKQRGGEPDTGWSLREILFRNRPALVIFDGHNLLFNLPDIFASYYEDDHPGRKARERLVELVGKLVAPRPNVQAKICFDGPKGASQNLAANLEIVYSGGTGANRADEVIISQLQFKDLKSLDQKVFVVTDDRQIRNHILQTGAKFVRNDLFALFLNDFGVLG